MSKEAMKLALEALELMYACYAHPEWISHKQQEEKILAQCAATTMTLRQALAKQEQSELAATERQVEILTDELANCQRALENQEQGEPVAWIDNSGHPKHMSHIQSVLERKLYGARRPLYTTPQQRTWVGLNWSDLPEEWVGNLFFKQGARWAETKLKEKNA